MIPRVTEPLCVICQEYTRYKAAESGYGEVQGVRVRVSKGDHVCLHHKLVDAYGQQLLIEQVEFAIA